MNPLLLLVPGIRLAHLAVTIVHAPYKTLHNREYDYQQRYLSEHFPTHMNLLSDVLSYGVMRGRIRYSFDYGHRDYPCCALRNPLETLSFAVA